MIQLYIKNLCSDTFLSFDGEKPFGENFRNRATIRIALMKNIDCKLGRLFSQNTRGRGIRWGKAHTPPETTTGVEEPVARETASLGSSSLSPGCGWATISSGCGGGLARFAVGALSPLLPR